MGIVLSGITAAVGDPAVVQRVDIRIDGETITKISQSPLTAKPEDTRVDGEGKLAIPGLVNAHTHIPMVLFRGLADDLPLVQWLSDKLWPVEGRLTADDVYWGSLLGLSEMIRSGTTAFADMYFHVDAIAKAVAESGVRALLSYGIIAPTLDAHGKEELRRAQETIERLNDGDGLMRGAVAPHAIYTCGKDVWRAAIELAQRYEVPIHTHLAETRDEVADCYVKHGASPVRLLDQWGAFSVPVLAAHCVHVASDDIEILRENEVSVVHCPKSNAKLGSGIAPIARMRAAGVNIALGTDGAASNNSLDMISELRFGALLAKGVNMDPTVIPASEALRMATAAGAAAIKNKDGGTIETGKQADVAIIDLTHLETVPTYDPLSTFVYSAGREAVSDVIVNGKFLMRNRKLITIDEDQVKYEVKRRVNRYKD